MTDEASRYQKIGSEFAKHDSVDHSRGEYGYTDRKTGTKVNTNTIEGYYSIFKRGMKGVYQHCGEKHCTATLRSSIFDIRTVLSAAFTTLSASPRSLKGLKASAWCIGALTKARSPNRRDWEQ
jgi:hypothetical protein